MIKPKVGFLIPRLGITDRGAEVFVYDLSMRLRKDFDVVVWVRRSDKRSKLLEDLIKNGVIIRKVSCLSETHAIAQILYRFSFLRTFLEKYHIIPSEIEMLSFSIACLPKLLSEKIDLLFPVNGIWGSIACRCVRLIKRTPFVYATLGGMEPLIARQKPNMYVSLFPTIARWLKINFSNLVVTYIPIGIDLKKFSPNGERATIDLPRPIFLTVSALVPEKQVDLTIKAVAKLKKGSLVIMGGGQLKSALVKLASEILGRKRFLFLSASHNDLPKYYRAADVFAFSAPWEVGWSIVHLEALASGLPVVANREENLQYLLGKDWPFFCNVSDVEDYSKSLIRATEVKVESRKLVMDYSWDTIAGKYKKILLGVINEQKKKN